MKIDVVTLFPQMLDGFLSESMMGRARRNGLVDICVHNLRDWAKENTSKWMIDPLVEEREWS